VAFAAILPHSRVNPSGAILKGILMSISKTPAASLAKSWLAAFVIIPLSSLPARSQESIDPNVTEYTLDNGLTVILAPSKTAQSVALVTQYEVGSADEAPGRSGFAHLFEHLMFEGTKAVPDFDKVVSSVGGQNNAFTQHDLLHDWAQGGIAAVLAIGC
jgi:zinc protease